MTAFMLKPPEYDEMGRGRIKNESISRFTRSEELKTDY
ncbi:hypothetical protein KP77_31240 [Jeotgalibacillus alimentarius]|uniref:Uncharacterized protein n=1 Tax=Jeotgalibacillus alimentarius TaxID=135826 RepID=A0A0C2V2Z5_9BACL|nr:hypothetical protein KP77_31240 [Jeotgalibacillus alimentarius]